MIRAVNRVQISFILGLGMIIAIVSPWTVARTSSKHTFPPPTLEMLLVHSLHSSGLISHNETPPSSRKELIGSSVNTQFKALAAVFKLDFGVNMTVSRNIGRVIRPDIFSFSLSDAASPGTGPLQILGRHLNGALQLRCENVTLSSVPAESGLYVDGLQVPTHLVPLPQAAQASGESNAIVSLLSASSLSADPTASSLSAMVLLHWRSRSRTYISPVLETLRQQLQRGSTVTDVEAFVRDHCVIDVLPAASQNQWPPTVLRPSPPADPLSVPLTFGPWRSIGMRRVRAAGVNVWDPKRSAKVREATAPSYLRFYPEVQSEWSAVVPAMPPYCGLRNGSLSAATVQDLRAHHENIFLETAGRFPFSDQIMKAVTAIILPPIMDPVMDQVMTHVDHSVSDQTGHETVAAVPTPVVDRVTKALTYNLTSIMTDSIAAELVSTVVSSVTMQMAPRVAKQVKQHLLPTLRKRIAAHLHVSLPQKVGAVTSYLLERSLAPILTTQVTRAVTHALVPTLTMALSHSEDQVAWCRSCYNGADSARCSKCLYSPVSQFYLNYYSTYYSDYYAEYYQRYYADALRKMDEQQHPEPDQEEAAKLNVGRKAKDREDDLKKDAYKQGRYDMRRPMTPSGIAVD